MILKNKMTPDIGNEFSLLVGNLPDRKPDVESLLATATVVFDPSGKNAQLQSFIALPYHFSPPRPVASRHISQSFHPQQ